METWKQVESKGFTLLVCNDGRVKRPPHQTSYKANRLGVTREIVAKFEESILSQCKGAHGYMEVCTANSSGRKKHLVHRLVGMAFVDGFADRLTINHINGIKTDNRPENLEWVSLAKNTQLQWETGLVDLRGEKQPGSKLTSKRVVYIRALLMQGINAHTIAIVAGVDPTLIYYIRDGKRWNHI